MSIGEHRHCCVTFKYKDLYGKKPIVSETYENERISIKYSLPYLKCVVRLSCVVHGPIYGCFMGFFVNGFLSVRDCQKTPKSRSQTRTDTDAGLCT